MLQRFAFQQVILSCMAEEPAINGRNQAHRTLFGQQGFPAISVPAGFTTDVCDRVPEPSSADGTRLVGPAARLPVGVDFATRPFGEPLLVRIASAYEKLTKHRAPPAEFGAVRPE